MRNIDLEVSWKHLKQVFKQKKKPFIVEDVHSFIQIFTEIVVFIGLPTHKGSKFEL